MPKVIVQSIPDYTFAQLVTAPGRGFVADEPKDEDGDDLGPTPYELLGAALGACTAMTIQFYARRKKYPLEEVAVEVEHQRTHAEDCQDCEQDAGGHDPGAPSPHCHQGAIDAGATRRPLARRRQVPGAQDAPVVPEDRGHDRARVLTGNRSNQSRERRRASRGEEGR